MKKRNKVIFWSSLGLFASCFTGLLVSVVIVNVLDDKKISVKVVNKDNINTLFSEDGIWYNKNYLDKEDFDGITHVDLNAFNYINKNVNLDYIDIPDTVNIGIINEVIHAGNIKKIIFNDRDNLYNWNNLIISKNENDTTVDIKIHGIVDKEKSMSLNINDEIFNKFNVDRDKKITFISFVSDFYNKEIFKRISNINIDLSKCFIYFGEDSFSGCKILTQTLSLNNIIGASFMNLSFEETNVESIVIQKWLHPLLENENNSKFEIEIYPFAFSGTNLRSLSLNNFKRVWFIWTDMPFLSELNIVNNNVDPNTVFKGIFYSLSDNVKIKINGYSEFTGNFFLMRDKTFSSFSLDLSNTDIQDFNGIFKWLQCDPNNFELKIKKEYKDSMSLTLLNEELLKKVTYV